MSDLDVTKMKVAELRAELQERGLDTKGVKALLQERLLAVLSDDSGSPAQGSAEEKEADEDGKEDDEEVDEVAEEATESVDQDEDKEKNTESDKQPGVNSEEPSEVRAQEEMPAEVMEEDTEPADEGVKEPAKKDEATTEETDAKSKEAVPEKAAPEEDAMQTEVNDDAVPEVKVEVKEEGKEEVEEVKKDVKDDEEKKADEKDKKPDVKQEGEERDRERRETRDRGHKDRRDRSPRRRSPSPPQMEEDDGIPLNQCVLSKYISDLNLKVAKEGYTAVPLTMDGFGFLWSGVKFTHGVTKGKVCYQVKLLEHLNVKHLPTEESTPHVIRVGWSLEKTTLQLGEEEFSYGYGGTAKFSTKCKFSNYGEKFGEGDVITTYLDFDAEKPTISYSKNGKDLGVAWTIDEDLDGNALFPHLLMKNTSIEVNVGQLEEPYFPITEGYTLIGDVPEEERVRGPLPPDEKKTCQIIMMVGLPGSGKTTWAEKFCADHPKEKYYIIGTNLIMDKMKVMGLRRQRNYSGRFDSLIDKSTKCLNRFFEMATRKKRNYILDQTNVYPSARRRKMRPFEGFSSKAIVLVPTDEEFKKRIEKRTKEEGKDVPDHAVLEMKANFELPVKGVMFDEVEYVELPDEEAKPLVDKYRKEGIDKLGPNYKRYNRDRNRGGQGNRDNRSKHDNRSPRGGQHGGNRGGSGGYQSRGGYRGDNSGSNYGWGYGSGYKDDRDKGGRSYGSSGSYGGNYGSGYGSSSSGGYGNRQNYGSYGSQGGGYGQNRSSNYSQSGSSYNTGGYSTSPTSNASAYGSYAGNYDYSGQYGQQYQQYQQYYQQQQQQSQSYNPYANYYSSYNSSTGSYQGR